MTDTSRPARAGLVASLVLVAGPAAAHDLAPGESAFLAGLSHPFLSLEQLLLLVAVGLLAGPLPTRQRPRTFLAALGGAVLAFGTEAASGPGGLLAPEVTSGMILCLGLVAGLVLALAPRLPTAVPWALTALAGAAVGFDSDVVTTARADAALSGLGVLIAIAILVVDAAMVASWATRPPLPIAVRVLGSWIAAIALMLLALTFAQHPVTVS